MNYGYFDDERREYVITNPKTPTKWINYLGTLAFGGFVDQTGGLLLCKGDPALNRISKYIPQRPPASFNGSTLYLRQKVGKAYTLFSPFLVPTLTPLDRYECRVGLGYSHFLAEKNGLRCEVIFFVPLGADCVVWDVRLTNVGDTSLEVELFPVVEYSHFDALKQLTNADWVPQTMQSRAVEDENGRILLQQYAFMRKEWAINYLSSSLPAVAFETERQRFLGNDGYGTWAAPAALQHPTLSNSEANRGDNIGALQLIPPLIRPNQTVRFFLQLGQTTPEMLMAESGRFHTAATVDAAFAALADQWHSQLSPLQIVTPDKPFNQMLNVHNPRQCLTTLQWSRYLSLYQLGYGARGIGVRDSAQDVMGILANAPAQAKAMLQNLLSVQKENGSAMHQFNPLTMEATEGDAREDEERPKFYSDDHLWIVLAVCAYVKETGDFDFLQQSLPFYEKDAEERPFTHATVLNHLKRAVAFTRQTVGRHGLPLLGFADWNDTVNLPDGSESLFTANLYGCAVQELITLFRHLQQEDEAIALEIYYQQMRQLVNEHGWDGSWYRRYFDEQGQPIGSSQNEEGQLFANGQSWPVLSGFATPERAAAGLTAVFEQLNTPNGIKLSTPGYNGYDPQKGGVSTYPPGAKENGGIFLHANPWVIIAETMQGNGDRAYDYYRQINPAAKNDKIEAWEAEPYVYPQNILGDEHPQFGLARNSWLTGTASWMYQSGSQYIVGIQPTYDGLKLDPCLPAHWEHVTVTRTYRGATYYIDIHNPHHLNKGAFRLQVDGQSITNNVIPVAPAGATVQVQLILEHAP